MPSSGIDAASRCPTTRHGGLSLRESIPHTCEESSIPGVPCRSKHEAVRRRFFHKIDRPELTQQCQNMARIAEDFVRQIVERVSSPGTLEDQCEDLRDQVGRGPSRCVNGWLGRPATTLAQRHRLKAVSPGMISHEM